VVDPTRHLVGDRLDITGARWGLAGAEAVLKLRALWSNGDFPPTGATTSPKSTGASTKPATSTHSPVQPDQQVPEIEPHPSAM
jgi:hypothetical protein